VDSEGKHIETTFRTNLPTFEKSKKAKLLSYFTNGKDMPVSNPNELLNELEKEFLKSKYGKKENITLKQ